MVDPIANADDVRNLINLRLETADIDPYLEDAAWANAQVNDADAMSDGLRERLEKWYAAYDILTTREGSRSSQQESLGSASQSYDANRVETLRQRIQRHDPSGELLEELTPDADFEVF